MDADALRTFVAIHEAGGFSSAAARLNRSQPAVSRRLGLLEEELGMALFERVSKGVVLSEAGRVLLPGAIRALAALRDCESAMADLRGGEAGSLTIVTVGTLAGANLTSVLCRFAAAHPRVRLDLSTATSAGVSDRVRSGAATIGLRYHVDPSCDLDCRELTPEPLEVVCPAVHPLAGGRIRSLRRLAGERWLAFPNADRLPDTAADNLRAQFRVLGIADVDWMAVDSLTAQKRLVEAGYGLAVLPVTAIAEELRAGTLATIRIAGLDLANPVCTVTRRHGYLSAAAKTLMDLLRGDGAAQYDRG